MVCDADDAEDCRGGGELGVPDADKLEALAERNLADEDGTGRKLWPGEGLAGSSGGALRLFLGMLTTG